MEQKLQNRYGRWGRALCFALALALAALLSLTALPLTGVYADDDVTDGTTNAAIDLGAANSLTIQLQTGVNKELQDLAGAGGLQVDLYQVATARKVDNYNVYSYVPASHELKEVFEKQVNELYPEYWVKDSKDGVDGYRYVPPRDDQNKVQDNYMPNGTLANANDPAIMQTLAQALTEAALESKLAPTVSNFDIQDPITNLGAGLYIALPHGVKLGTATTADDFGSAVRVPSNDDKETVIASLAVTDTMVFSFAPQLISLPGLTGGAVDTADPNATAVNWEYDVSANAKPGEQLRTGNLQITKTVNNYTVPATFVFDVEATLPDGTHRYTLKSMNFTDAGNQTEEILANIPAGSTVTVTESYPGTSYTLKSGVVTETDNVTQNQVADPVADTNKAADKVTVVVQPGNVVMPRWDSDGTQPTLEVAAGTTVTIHFTNEGNESLVDGGNVRNHFTPGSTPDAPNDRNGWTWEPITQN